jgi:hypothetical protein
MDAGLEQIKEDSRSTIKNARRNRPMNTGGLISILKEKLDGRNLACEKMVSKYPFWIGGSNED